MRMVSALLGVALVTAGGTAILLWREVGSERQQIADLKAQVQQREAHAAVLTATPELPASGRVTPPSVTTPAATSASSAAAIAPDPGFVVPDGATISALMSSPEAMERMRQFRRGSVVGLYAYIDEALGLTPDEAGKLLVLLAEHQKSRGRREANSAEMQAMLGSKYPKWLDYQQTLPVWQQMRDLDAVATAGDIPLSAAQFQSLTTALLAEHRAFTQREFDNMRSNGYGSGSVVQHTPERHQRLLDIAAPHLTPHQHESYRGMDA